MLAILNFLYLAIFLPKPFAYKSNELSRLTSLSINDVNKKITRKEVWLHLEKIDPIFPIFHVGVSFNNSNEEIRYDFRPLNDVTDNMLNKTIYWGYTDKSTMQILGHENNINLKNQNYILGINDCRHYARKLTKWATGRPTPVWRLIFLWYRAR